MARVAGTICLAGNRRVSAAVGPSVRSGRCAFPACGEDRALHGWDATRNLGIPSRDRVLLSRLFPVSSQASYRGHAIRVPRLSSPNTSTGELCVCPWLRGAHAHKGLHATGEHSKARHNLLGAHSVHAVFGRRPAATRRSLRASQRSPRLLRSMQCRGNSETLGAVSVLFAASYRYSRATSV